eukprot:scaffold13609_cov106-Isochrysis_galbana.AAC.7
MADPPVDRGRRLAAVEPSPVPVVERKRVHRLPERTERLQPMKVYTVAGDEDGRRARHVLNKVR